MGEGKRKKNKLNVSFKKFCVNLFFERFLQKCPNYHFYAIFRLTEKLLFTQYIYLAHGMVYNWVTFHDS